MSEEELKHFERWLERIDNRQETIWERLKLIEQNQIVLGEKFDIIIELYFNEADLEKEK